MVELGTVGCLLILMLLFAFPTDAVGSEDKMKGPHARVHRPQQPREFPTSSTELVFLKTIRFYQKWISPTGGVNRCGFRPSCSVYGYTAIQTQGPLVGVLMTADRLTRCNLFKKPGADYYLLPEGRLYDPVSMNLPTAK